MSPFPNLLHTPHTTSFTPQPTKPSPQQHPPIHRPLRFIAQIISPYDLLLQPGHAQPQTSQTQTQVSTTTALPRRPNHQILAPDFDVRETEWAYFLEGEFPGIKDRDSIRLEWVDYRTLAIETRIPRIDLAEEWGALYTACFSIKKEDSDMDIAVDSVEGGEDDGPICREAEIERRKMEERHQVQPVVKEWLSERRVGLYQRTFTFPADVDASQVRARLGQGLLRILVPKIRERRGSGRKVHVESVE